MGLKIKGNEMKIRILGNSIRVRLTKSEVRALWEQGQIEEITAFTTNTLVYCVKQHGLAELQVDFKDNQIILLIPQLMADALYNTQKVGFENNLGPVSILIEKDFACLDRKAEDQSDHYPNPLSNL